MSQGLCSHRSCSADCSKSGWPCLHVEGEESSRVLMAEGSEARCKREGAFHSDGLGSQQAQVACWSVESLNSYWVVVIYMVDRIQWDLLNSLAPPRVPFC